MTGDIRKILRTLAERIPEDGTLDDAIDYLRFVRAVEDGKRAAERGEFATDEEVRRMFAKWGVEWTNPGHE